MQRVYNLLETQVFQEEKSLQISAQLKSKSPLILGI